MMGVPSPNLVVSLDSHDVFPAGLAGLTNKRISPDDSEPETKRRKLNDSTSKTSPDELFSILLRRIQIRLTFSSKSEPGFRGSETEVELSVPVTIKSVERQTLDDRNEDYSSDGPDAHSVIEYVNSPESLSFSRTDRFRVEYLNNSDEPEGFSFFCSNDVEELDVIAIIQAAVPFQKSSSKKLCKTSFTIIKSSASGCVIQLDVRWKDSKLFADIPTNNNQFEFLKLLTADLNPPTISAWSPRDFYDSVYVPDKEDKSHESLDISEIQSTLFAYQKRTVQWMLHREGVDLNGQSLPETLKAKNGLHGWSPLRAANGQQVFINQWLGLVTTHEELMNNPYTEVSGGILAEEMGLGKTVEIIALLVRNRRYLEVPEHQPKFGLQAANATLIIAPESIVTQWAAEINLHAPSLQTLLYPGVKQGGKKKEKELLKQIQDSDIVLCSYNTLAREVHFARDPPDRFTRNKPQSQRQRLRSPLVQLHWWRCVLDECQMIQSGVSSAAEVALQIPRQHAWAVSGTPLRKDPGDVYGLLRFLGLLPYSWSVRTWTRLLDQYQDIFKDLIKRITLRHTKHLVKDEIELPPQKRIVSTVSLTQIEEQHYSNTFDRMCQRIGLDRDGAPLSDDWDPEDSSVIEQMRTWLTRLRQLCLHPDVGGRNSRALGGRVQDVLRTVEDVLQVMTDQNEVGLRTDERAFFMTRLRQGQLLEYEENTQEALETWQDVLVKIQEFVRNSRDVLEKATPETDDKDEKWTPEKAASNNRLGQLRTRLRLALELEHMAQFFIGNAYFQIKDNKEITVPESDRFTELEKLEVEKYDIAKAIRVEMLIESRETVQRLISDTGDEFRWDPKAMKAAEKGFPRVEESGGIESNEILDNLDQLAQQYNKLVKQTLEWRGKLTEMLSKPLVDYAAEDVQGDEYETSTKEQDEVYARMDIFRAAVTDLSEILTGQENALIKNEAAGWAKLAKEGKGHAPEIMLELLNIRNSLKPSERLGSIRGILSRLRSVKTSFRQGDNRDVRRRVEAEIMGRVESTFRTSLSDHDTINRLLNRDVGIFIGVQNGRLEFYRQLQHISDLVAPWPEEEEEQAVDNPNTNTNGLSSEQIESRKQKKIEQLRKKLIAEGTQLQQSITKKVSQARYLEHLKNASSLGDERKCIICQDERYEIGVLTACGHLFCKDCMNAWLASHAKCPQCRATIKSRSELYQITYKPQELRMEEEVTSERSDSSEALSIREESPKLTSIYSQISVQQLNEIKSIDLPHNFGTKIDFIARHIIWLRKSDPGNKTVVFSQFRRFCPGKLSQAFSRLGIRYAVVGGKIGVDRFKHDPNIECLLMHAGSQASGMNLVNASHVLLCEPLVNTALELQAIARVHRIGQHRPTTVWMYLIEGTVEKAIYDLSVERRLEHIGNQRKHKRSGTSTPKRIDEDIEAVDAEVMNDRPLTTLLNKTEEGGEIVGKDDLWQCLFGTSHPRRGLPELQIEDADEVNIG